MIRYEILVKTQEQANWSSVYSFVVPVKGTALLFLEKERIQIEMGDVVFMHPFQHFMVSEIQGACMICQIDLLELIPGQMQELEKVQCNSTGETNKSRYKHVIYALTMAVEARNRNNSYVLERKWSYELLEDLLCNFSQVKSVPEHSSSRVREILQYISENYAENLTLTGLAKKFYVSTSYLSKIFKEEIGKNFLEYVNEVRLMHAVRYLMEEKLTIEQIAEVTGFKNARSFSGKFRERYQILPSEYRKQKKEKKEEQLDINAKEHFDAFVQQLEQEERKEDTQLVWKKQTVSGVCVDQYEKVPYQNGILTIRRANHLLMYQVREAVKQIVKELHFTGIYFHELFNDDMEIYSLDPYENPEYHFYKLDQLFDLVVECGLTPYVELAFVPFLMAENVTRKTMVRNSVSNMPADMEQWRVLVRKVVEHLMQRYGKENVLRWNFCVWSSPDNKAINYSAFAKENYYAIYLETWKVLKSIDSRMQVGTPALMTQSLLEADWMNHFNHFCRENNCLPDFVMVNLYMIENDFASIQKHLPPIIMHAPDAMKKMLCQIENNNKACQWNIKRLCVAEWNFNLFLHAPIQDSMFMAAYIVKNMIDCWKENVMFGVMDPIENSHDDVLENGSFQGKRGLLTYDNIKKSSYYAYAMLAQMGDLLVTKGENYLITRSEHQIQLLLCNYQPLSKAYCERKITDEVISEALFEELFGQEYELQIQHLAGNMYLKETCIINEDFGNAFDFCRKYRKAESQMQYDVSYINDMSQPLKKTDYINPTENGNIYLYEYLKPFEIRLICLTEM